MDREMLVKFLELLVDKERRLEKGAKDGFVDTMTHGDLMEIRRFKYQVEDLLSGRRVA
jgi:hypothetical protein